MGITESSNRSYYFLSQLLTKPFSWQRSSLRRATILKGIFLDKKKPEESSKPEIGFLGSKGK